MADFAVTPKTSKAAIAALVLGGLSFACLGPLAAVPGLLLGLVGIAKTSRGKLKGRGLAVGGLLLSVLNVLVVVVLFSQIVAELQRRGFKINLLPGVVSAESEVKATAALRQLHAAQQVHKARAGSYARDISALLADDPGLAGIAAARDPGMAHEGYYFLSVTRQGAGFVDHGRGFVIVAVPAEYGKSGKRTFAIGPTGAVLARDTGGRPVSDASELAGWRVVK